MALSNKEIPTDLREYIEINILPQYATFDKAHRLNHAEIWLHHIDVDSSQCATSMA